MNKRLIILTETFYPDACGVADYLNVLIYYFTKSELDIHVVTRTDISGSPQIVKQNGFTIHKVIDERNYIFRINKYIKNLKPDIVDVQMAYSKSSRYSHRNLFAGWIVPIMRFSNKNTKIIITVHELCINNLNSTFLQRTYSKFRDLPFIYFCHGAILTDISYSKYFKKFSYRWKYIRSYSNVLTYKGKKTINVKQLVFFGTITRHKNLEFLVELLSILRIREQYTLKIIGAVLDKKYYEELNSLIEMYNLKPYIIFEYIKDLNDVAKIIAESSGAVFPLRNKVTLRNTSITAALVQGVRTFIYSDEELYPFEYRSPNLTVLEELSIEKWAEAVLTLQNDHCSNYIDNESLISEHIKERLEFYTMRE